MMPFSIKASLSYIKLIFLFGLFLFPTLPYAFISVLIIGLIVFSIVDFKVHQPSLKAFFFQTGFYWIILFSLIYSANLNEGVAEIQRTLAIIVIPFALFFSYQKEVVKHRIYLQIFYILANIILIGIIYSFLIKGMAKDRMPTLPELSFVEQLKFLWSYPYEFVREKSIYRLGNSWFINHKTLLAFNFLTASFFCIQLMFQEKVNALVKLMLLVALFVFVLCIFYTQSLINVGLLVLLPIYFLLMIKKPVIQVISVLIIIGASTLLFNKLDLKKAYNNRNTEAAFNLWSSIKEGKVNADSDPRLYINYCNIELIKKSPLVGFGVGDVQDMLNNCYTLNQFEPKIKKERIFNSHNYFAHLWLSGGFLSVVFFVVLLFKYFAKSLISKNVLLAFIIIIIAVNLMFDNILLRYQGSVYFGLLYTFLFITLKSSSNGRTL